jgi:hypothetical protein
MAQSPIQLMKTQKFPGNQNMRYGPKAKQVIEQLWIHPKNSYRN